jgi:deoxyribonuclease-4
MPILGAHQSIAGGYPEAVKQARQTGCDCVQLFTQNNNQWAIRQVSAREGKEFQAALLQSGVSHPIAHDSYLINLASPDDVLWQRSIEAFVGELRRADTLGIPYVVTHPGAYTTASEEIGLKRVIRALDTIHRRTRSVASRCLLETTAGQGTTLGWRFEHLGAILAGVKQPERLGVCFDTCHVFAAGYAMGTATEYRHTMSEFDRLVGLGQLKAFHLNDSRRELGSRVDRHDHIGRGKLGLAPFRHLLRDRRFRDVPMYLETPKGTENGEDLDVINLRTLRELAASKR